MLFYKPSLERLGVTVTRAHRRRCPVREPHPQLGLRHHHAGVGRVAVARQRAARLLGLAIGRRAGSQNYVGIKNPAVDALIDRVIFAKNRDELVAATKALDRVLLWNHYVVPQFTYDKARTARWDRFSHPDPMPKYGMSEFPTIWWWDQAKAAKTGSRQ